MPKEAKEVGRKACMDEMCHRCKTRCADGSGDCGRTICPLYSYSPYAAQDAWVGWKKLRTGKAVGFTPRKGVTAEELKEVVETLITDMPVHNPILVKQCRDMGIEVPEAGPYEIPILENLRYSGEPVGQNPPMTPIGVEPAPIAPVDGLTDAEREERGW